MSINNRYVSQSSVWYHDRERAIDSIGFKLEKEGLINNWQHKSQIQSVIEEELEPYTLYRNRDYSKTGVTGWRVLYALLVVFQWVLWPYGFIRWLRTGNFRVPPQSKLGIAINRIVDQATN